VQEAHWGESTPWSVGAEEELMLVHERTLLLAAESPAVIAAGERELGPGHIKTELFASVVELNTGVCEAAGEAAARLAELRGVAGRLAGELGLRIFAAGSHPVSRPEEQAIVPEERYIAFVDYAGISARRQGVNGLHVHVGMPDAETCMRALEGALPWLPAILALSANSPYLSGEETGLASSRAEVLALLPRSGAPPLFRDFAEWDAFIERLKAVELIPDYTMAWWDVRPHPRFGTLEVRMPDQPTEVAASGGLIALLQSLCVWAARGEQPAYDPPARAIYQQNRWAALRYGLDAELLHPDRDEVVSARDLVADLVAALLPVAAELGSEPLLAALDLDRTGAERQLEIGRGEGLAELTRWIVDGSLD
jgi:glutamate---cysteine ligase / carboxylate-amine ligase